MIEPLGLYVSVPFCTAKCSYCNFASDVAAAGRQEEYCELLEREIALAAALSPTRRVDTVYWGGGTPSLLAPERFLHLAACLRSAFDFDAGAEYTLEAAPGSLDAARLGAWRAAGVNRISFGMQSFQTAELRAVGRRHSAATLNGDLERLRTAGLENIGVDLIAGLPHQTSVSWEASLDAAIAAGVPHVSIYMLEVDGDSRLGRELLAGGARYHAGSVPDEDAVAAMYETACRRLPEAGLAQYEISNFARPGYESRHNERYWLRQPYLGMGLDAHSFVEAPAPTRWRTPDDFEAWASPLRDGRLPWTEINPVSAAAAAEERVFLGLRRTAGIVPPPGRDALVARLAEDGLIDRRDSRIHLTPLGRLLSNEVFTLFLEPGMDMPSRAV